MNQSPPDRSRRFLIILVIILGVLVLAAIVLPGIAVTGPKKPTELSDIRGRLKEIKLAKYLWAEDRHATNGTIVSNDDLRGFCPTFIGPATFELNPIGVLPVARTQKKLSGLPAGTLLRVTESNAFEGKLPNARESDPWQPIATLIKHR